VTTDDEEVFGIYMDVVGFRASWSQLREDEIIKIRDGTFVHRRAKRDAETLSPIGNVLFKIAANPLMESIERLVLLQPTSPFRNSRDIEELTRLANTRDWTSIFSVKDVGGVHPNRMYTINEDGFASPVEGRDSQDNVPRQLLNKVYIKDGAFYLFRKNDLLQEKLIGDKPLCFRRSAEFNVNIDSAEDLVLANALWGRK
jgi:CMP-N-acetylneuraminic acid synthetase